MVWAFNYKIIKNQIHLPDTEELKKDDSTTRISVCTDNSSRSGRNTPGNINNAYCNALLDFSQSIRNIKI